MLTKFNQEAREVPGEFTTQTIIKFTDFEEANAKEHLSYILWVTIFLRLEEKQNKQLFPLTIGPLQ